MPHFPLDGDTAMPYILLMETPLHTVAETAAAVQQIAADPTAGDLIVGSGGIRKVRVAGRGKGKSGGYRVATAHLNSERPVYLLFVLSKGRAANFTADQIKALKTMMDRLREA
ncbi:type II toxin-antitoxin system RelE/ParE family toxin [Brevundimonas sp.]|uniref:type II toxin-antitoxin system RelE/ParE family toxin n=1 Tax=Brevundimonas sp. TaxID=1871086 RepID=UPI00344D88A0